MITIHEGTASTFSDNGIAVIEPLSCNFIVNINGSWSLELEMPFDEDQKYKKLQKGNIIKIDDIPVITEQQSNYQLFRIYDDVLTLTSVKVIAFPVAFEATNDAIIEEEYTTGDTAKTLTQIMAGAIDYLNNKGVTKYTVTVDYPSTPTKTASYQDTNLLAMIAGTDDTSILNTWNTEAVYDNYNIKIKQKIGDQSSDYEVRYGKNLTGLSVDTDTSGVVTRLYPKSAEGIRLNLNNKSYIDADNVSDYPYVRGGFVQAPYSLVDTDDKSHSACAKLTRQAKTAIKNAIYDDVHANWLLICLGETIGNIFFEPEYIKTVLNDVISMLQEDEDIIDPAYNASLKSLIKLCIKDGVSWIKDQEIADYKWSGSAGSWKYGNTQRDISNQYIFVDKKYSWFDENGIWHPEKDDEDFKWIQKKGDSSAKKFGNNSKYFAHDTWVYTMSGDTQEGSSFNQYKFNADGWWTGISETSEWSWQQDSVSGKWWFGKVGATSESQWAHDCWLYIYDTNQPGASKSLYYFGSDGYMVPSLTTLVNWSWHQDKNNYWFGSDDKEQNAVYVADQWLKINGEWIYFMDNHPMNSQAAKILLYDMFKDIILGAAGSAIEFYADELYALLYNNMKDYCENLFAKGLSNPTITVTANVVDLSKTTEYADYGSLMTMHLGDKVRVIDYEHFNAEYYLRVVGLKYDCIRGFNAEVTIGDLSKTVTQMVSPSIGKTEGDKLVPGENVTIDGNVINVINQSGDIFPGTDVQIDQLVTGGTALARIYLDGVPVTIYGSKDVEVIRTLTTGTQIADIKVGDQHNYLFAPSGLQYWVETSEQIYRTGQTAGLIGDDDYFVDDTHQWEITKRSGNYPVYHRFRKTNAIPAIYGVSDGKETMYIVSPTQAGIQLEWQRWFTTPEEHWGTDYHNTGWQTWDNTNNWMPEAVWFNFEYKGCTWYGVRYYFSNGTTDEGGIKWFDGSHQASDIENAKLLIDAAHAEPFRPDKEGISNQDHILFYNSYPNDPNHEDDVFVSKSGVFHGTRFEDADGNPISGGGLSKTELYSSSSYAASITLASAYTGYQFLLIQTYNPDDKESLSTMLNVSDLATGNRIGINDYLLYTITNSTTLTFYDSFDDTNHSRRIKGIYGLKTFSGSDVPNIITDVKDGDTSVVSGGVAQISGKQDKLTAGNNIQIASDGKTVSATDTTYNEFAGSSAGLVPEVQTQANKFLRDDGTWATASGASSVDTLTDVNLTSLANGQILKYNSTSQKWENANEVSYSDFAGSTHGLVPEVQTQAGKFLKDDGSWDTPASGSTSLDGLTDVDLTSPTDGQILKYDANSQEWVNANESGGTNVVANPSGTATTSLTKLQVENTIYSIPSGGDLSNLNNWNLFADNTTVNDTILADELLYGNYTASKGSSKTDKKFFLNSCQIIGYDSNNTAYNLEFAVWQVSDMSSSYQIFYWIHNNTNVTIVKYTITLICTYPKVSGGGGGGASALDDLTDVDVSAPTNGQVLTYNSTSQQWENVTPSGGASYTDVTGTLTAGSTSITLSDASIDSTKTFDFYTDTFGVNPTAVSVSSGSITLTFEAQSSAVDVKVRVW